MSDLLLGDAAAQAKIAAGDLVSDSTVADALFGALLDPAQGADAAGIVVDGFPRTPLQVDLMVLLHEKLTVRARVATIQRFDEFPI